nr:preprotein translocase subunit SecE [Mycolicibacterium diernhoferi]
MDGGTSGSAGAPAGPLRPSGKRSRRTAAEPAGGAVAVSESDDADDAGADEKPAKRTKTAKAAKSTDGARLNPFAFVWNYLKQVVGELRKVIWPNRKQMVTYTTVVLVFLAFMVAMIGGVDLGLAKLVSLIFG